jgi:energy-coupling factor transport system ATP-binding protein
MIEFENVYYTYEAAPTKKSKRAQAAEQADWGNKPDSYWALQNITFTLADGEFLGIAGHTGSGKSTLIQHMNGLVHPTHGRVVVNGADIADKEAAAKARCDVGLVFQYPEHQLFAATVFDDVAFGPRNMGVASDQLEERVREAMKLVELDFDTLRGKSPFELSGGQQRRVAFAGVLAMSPRTLILDEPVAGLDPESREDFLQLIATLHEREGMTVVMVSHSMDDLARFCTRILVLNRGSLFALGSPAQVFSDADALKGVGLDVPSAQHLANTLCEGGVKLPRNPDVYTVETLADALASLYREKA